MTKVTNTQNGWTETTLGEIAKFSQGFQVATNYQYPEKKDGYTRFVRIVDYTNEGEIPRYIENPKRCFVEEDDLVMIRYGSQTAGKVVRGISGVIANNTFQIIPNNDIDKNWLYWFLNQSSIYQFLNKDQSSSTMPAVTFTQVGNLEINIPPLPEQKAIAKALSSIDDKIELLREQNKTLEETAQAIFREWFECREGIDTVTAKEHIDFEKGIEVGSKNYFEKQENDYVPFFRVGDIEKNGNESKIFVDPGLLKKGTFQEKDILISFDGTVGRVFIGGNGGYSSGIRKIISKDSELYSDAFLYFWANSKTVQKTIDLYSEGTTIMHAGKSIEYLELPTNEELLNKFNKLSLPIFAKLTSNISQIKTLSTLRDTLLPKLMRGEVRVKNF